jgi:hypothetical protein
MRRFMLEVLGFEYDPIISNETAPESTIIILTSKTVTTSHARPHTALAVDTLSAVTCAGSDTAQGALPMRMPAADTAAGA